jgi:hypothetical protein
MAESDNQNTVNRKWPWDWIKEPTPKPAIVKIIAENFPSYARDTYDYHFRINRSGFPKEYLLYNCFLQYYRVVKDYIEQQFYKIPISLQAGGRKTCNDLLDLSDRLKESASPPPYIENQDEIPPTPDCYAYKWDTLIKKLNMLIGSMNQEEKNAEKKQNVAPAINIQNSNVIMGDVHQPENLQVGGNARIYKHEKTEDKKKGILRRIPYWIYLLVSFLAALLAILHYSGWLKR